MAQKFQTGDNVYHKSNLDLVMTIVKYNGTKVVCRWLDKSGKPRQAAFEEAELISEQEGDQKTASQISQW